MTDSVEHDDAIPRVLHGPPSVDYWLWRYAHESRMEEIRELDVEAWVESLADDQ